MICAPGAPCTSRCSAGWKRAASSSWLRMYAHFCASEAGRKGQPTAVVMDSRTLRSTPQSGIPRWLGWAKRHRGSKVHRTVDTLGHLLALTVTAADEGDHAQVAKLAWQVQRATGKHSGSGLPGPGLTPAQLRLKQPRSTASGSWWRSILRRNAASCCCPDAGSSSALLLGPRAFVAWYETANDPASTLAGLHLLALSYAHAAQSRKNMRMNLR